MKRILFFMLFLTAAICHAQNYNCLQFGPKNYFTNGNGYLRGIRIDSVTISGTDTVYHPFRTPRFRGYVDVPGPVITTEVNGGSWLGRDVVQQSNGIWLFDNIWHDTAVVKVNANVGDSWVFYNDTTNIEYTATVVSMDTMTVLGTIDSIKTIAITADSAGIPRVGDPVNNFQLKLSKDHGFVQIFDLYTFPYHMADTLSDICNIDYYLDLVLKRNNIHGDLEVAPLRGNLPDVNNSIFHLITFPNPTRKAMFDFASNDIYENYYLENQGSGWVTIERDFLDTVISAVHTPTSVSFSLPEHYTQIISSSTGRDTTFNLTNLSGFYDESPFIDTVLMPEEKGNTYYYNYLPDVGPDTSFCGIHGAYIVNRNYLVTNDTSGIVNYSHGPDFGYRVLPLDAKTYYVGYGLWNIAFADANNRIDQNITYFYKSGTVCYGTFRWLAGIKNINESITQLQLIPNPANNQLTIKTNITGAYTIIVTNILGQVVTELNTTNPEEKIITSNLQNGMYSITLTDNQGNRITQKLIVTH